MSLKAKATLIMCCIVFFCSSCLGIDSQPAVSSTEEVNMIKTSIDSLNLTLELPEGLVRQPTEGAPRFCFEAERMARFQRCFSILAVESMPENIANWESVSLLHSEGAFYYQTEWLENPGSSGPIHVLDGYVVVYDHYFRVTARALQESRNPHATWCIPMIQTLRYEGE